MIVSEAITKAFQHAQGKPVAPAVGTPKYNQLIIIADSMQKLWAAETGVDWNSLYNRASVTGNGTSIVSLTTLTPTFDHVINDPSTPITVSGTEYTLIRPTQLHKYKDSNVVSVSGTNLRFYYTKVTSGTISVPYIAKVNDIIDGTATIQVDDPMWLVYAMAAEFDRNDIVKAANYDDLLQLAEAHMAKMKENNEGTAESVNLGLDVYGESWI